MTIVAPTDPPRSIDRGYVGRRRRPTPDSLQQWWALSLRLIKPALRNGEIISAIISPIVFTVGFYLPLKFVMSFQGVDYAQFLMPIIALQALSFTALSAAMNAALDRTEGITDRFKTMPIRSGVPLAARMSANLFRLVVSLSVAIACGYVIGFRFHLGWTNSVGFCALALLVGFALTMGGDAIGTLSKTPEATTQALTLPQLILGMLSTGFVPITGFPEWIQPFVRNQPISVIATAMRDMTSDGVDWPTLWPALAWSFGALLVFAPITIWANGRRQ
ncbi:ABC transporter permease [Tomitella cavernea]|uniref:Daunorubicin ABC transporter ATP-binding protein DrrA n=1 Tax=Tomitella cavernea TaxID=1387982 RepID=A0ABP9C9V6_9ACTN|nr:ABC transporter permease [Tomitella cavernea]